jgi:hypothetical protein
MLPACKAEGRPVCLRATLTATTAAVSILTPPYTAMVSRIMPELDIP